MKAKLRIILIMILVCRCNFVNSQNYLRYYQYFIDGDRAFYKKRYEEAFYFYEKAISTVPYIHLDRLKKIITCASKLNKTEKVLHYTKQYYLVSADSAIFQNKLIKKRMRLASFSNTIDSLLKAPINYPYNRRYQEAIDSMSFVDQVVLRSNYQDTTKYNLKDREKLEMDNFNLLLSYINKYGYPSEKTIGKERYLLAYAILLHNIRLPKNQGYLPIVEKALYDGDCQPEDYGWLIDQITASNSQNCQFCIFESNKTKFSKDEKLRINQIRYNYGMKPIEAFRCIKIFSAYITYSKW